MSSITEINKRCKIVEEEHPKDRISDLPSDVLSNILSSLDIDEAVRTSVLSRRWQNCWTLTTNLDLDDKFGEYPQVDRPGLRDGFMDIMHRVLTAIRSVHKLRIRSREYWDDVQLVNAYIAAAVRPMIQELEIKIKLGPTEVILPQNLFYCRELVDLKLSRNFAVDIPASVTLSKLKILNLFEVRLKDGDSVVRLLSGCPVLEELKIEVCFGADVQVVNISSPTLKNLTLIHSCYDNFDKHSFVERVVLDTPLLQHLLIDDYVVAKAYLLNNLDHLDDVWIDIYDPSEEYGQSYYDAMFGLLDGLSSARKILLVHNDFFEGTGICDRFPNHRFTGYDSTGCCKVWVRD